MSGGTLPGWQVTLILAGAAVALVLWLAAHPFSPCRWCQGRGRNRLSARERWGRCPHCDGSGRRVRAGARLLRRALRWRDL